MPQRGNGQCCVGEGDGHYYLFIFLCKYGNANKFFLKKKKYCNKLKIYFVGETLLIVFLSIVSLIL